MINPLTEESLAASIGCGIDRVGPWMSALIDAMQRYGIDTPIRQAAFLAQVGHETGGLRHIREIWGPTIAQARYDGRRDLGNTTAGDGFRYRGRGLIQITGRANYAACSVALYGYPSRLLTYPELLEQPDGAAMSAGWYWHSRGCNELADDNDFNGITRKINGGLNGLDDRLARWDKAKTAMGVA